MIPNREQIIEAVREDPDRLTRREIARLFGVKGDDRRELRKLLRAMVEDGTLLVSKKKTYRQAEAMPRVMVLRILNIDEMGDLIAEPDKWEGEATPPRFIVIDSSANKSSRNEGKTLGEGGRALCRIITPEADPDTGLRRAKVLKRLSRGPSRHMGLLMKDGRGWIIRPLDKRVRDELRVRHIPIEAKERSLVLYEAGEKNRRSYERMGRIIEVLADMNDPKAPTLMSLAQHNIPVGFMPEVIDEAKAAKQPTLSDKRTDLREIGLLTIDPVDAKDFDDAIYAEPDPAPSNPEGHIIWVAIADVAHYVHPDSALDNSARERGNSVYLPDRVEPMLPEELSNNLCSLRPHEDRYCMAVKMRIRKDGVKISHKFYRGLMNSKARLTYAEAQETFDSFSGKSEAPKVALPVTETLKNIFKAYESLRTARLDRAPLAIELPERRIHIAPDGSIASITVKERYDAHKLIEEFMVQANVAAAEALAQNNVTSIVRIHEPPSQEKVDALSDFLPVLGLSWTKGARPSTKRLNGLLGQADAAELTEVVGMAVLRSQSQAYYGLEGKGHFGLNLTHYGHFTSPIRRYADLVLHRALIKLFNFGDDGTTKREESRLKETAEHISDTERRAMAAERDAKDRYIAQYLENKIGAEFPARISGVTKIGLFITLDETGADGLIPARTLGQEYFQFNETERSLVGEDTGGTYRFGRRVSVRLISANSVTGGMIFEMLSPPEKGSKPSRSGHGRNRKFNGKKHKSGRKSGRSGVKNKKSTKSKGRRR